jgi:hypothetical protein
MSLEPLDDTQIYIYINQSCYWPLVIACLLAFTLLFYGLVSACIAMSCILCLGTAYTTAFGFCSRGEEGVAGQPQNSS